MADKHFVPRWRYQRVEIPAEDTVRLDPVPFSNMEVWPWDLRFLSLTGEPVVATEGTTYLSDFGGVAGRVELKMGMSQWGSLNYVPIEAVAMMPPLRRPLTLPSWAVYGSRFQFERPIILPPDDTIVAEVQNTSGDAAGGFSLVFNGYRYREDGTKQPEQLAGRYDAELGDNVSDTLDSSDLSNDGEGDIHMVDMILDPTLTPPAMNTAGLKSAWKVNPNTGIQWMDQGVLIPEGNLAPFNRLNYDDMDAGPRAFEFPKGTVMRRRQRLETFIRNLTEQDQVVHVCLFGYLEVS